MMTKKEQSIELRRQGFSVKEISRRLNAAQGSVSTWVRNVLLSPEQKLKLKKHSHSPEVVERRRQSRLQNQKLKRQTAIDTAANDIHHLDRDTLRIVGSALYWGEGAKTKIGMARITNSDPALVKIIMRFFREVCEVPENKFRCQIHIHSAEAVERAEEYWSSVTNIPLNQFYKTYCIKSKSSKNKRFTLPHGTIEVAVGDVNLHLRILGWIEGLKRQIT